MKGVFVLGDRETNELKLLVVNEPYRSLMPEDGSMTLASAPASVTAKLYPCDGTKIASLAVGATSLVVDESTRVLARAIAIPPVDEQSGSDRGAFDTMQGQLGFRLEADPSTQNPQLKMIELSANSNDMRVRQYEVLSGRLLFIRSDKEEEAYELSDTPPAFIRSDKEEEDVSFLESTVAFIRSG